MMKAGLQILGLCTLVIGGVVLSGCSGGAAGRSPAPQLPTSGSASATAARAKVSVVPSSAPAGATIRVSGSGFSPGELVSLSFSTDQGVLRVGDVTADPSGSFQVSQKLPVDVAGLVGVPGTLDATGYTSVLTGTAPFEVSR